MRILSLVIIGIICFSCGTTSPEKIAEDNRIEVLATDNLSLEDKAAALFLDSIWNKTKYFESSSDDFILSIPDDYDSSWVKDGIFHNWKIYTDGLIDSVSVPYYERHIIDSYSDSFETTEQLNAAKEFCKDYDSLISEGSSIIDTLNIDALLLEKGFEEFIKMDSTSTGFLKIKRHLESSSGYQVQLEVFNTELREPVFFDDQLTIYQFYVFFDKDGQITRWTTK